MARRDLSGLRRRIERVAADRNLGQPDQIVLVFGVPGQPGTWAERNGKRVPVPSVEELLTAPRIGDRSRAMNR